MDLKGMSLDELKDLQNQIASEINLRCDSTNLILYTHNCKDSSNHHLGKYKHWAKQVTTVDTTKTNGYAFIGNFLKVASEHKLPIGSVVVEVCDKDIICYKLTDNGKTKVASGYTQSMCSFIDDVSKLFSSEVM